jgi:hypothetical protein
VVRPPAGPEELSAEVRELLADLPDGRPTALLSRDRFLVEAPNRDGTPGQVTKGGIFLHEPTVALLLPSDFPPLARRRPEFASLRHVLVRFSFMLDRLPPRHDYQSAQLIITLDEPAAVVRAQRPSWVTADTESVDSVTTEFSTALTGLVRMGAGRTRVTEVRQQASRPVITAENRGPAGFGWSYQAQPGMPLLPRVEFTLAVVELPASAQELSGTMSAEAMISEPRFGIMTSTHALPALPPAHFRRWLGDVGHAAG